MRFDNELERWTYRLRRSTCRSTAQQPILIAEAYDTATSANEYQLIIILASFCKVKVTIRHKALVASILRICSQHHLTADQVPR
jgi:hypothetical protein